MNQNNVSQMPSGQTMWKQAFSWGDFLLGLVVGAMLL